MCASFWGFFRQVSIVFMSLFLDLFPSLQAKFCIRIKQFELSGIRTWIVESGRCTQWPLDHQRPGMAHYHYFKKLFSCVCVYKKQFKARQGHTKKSCQICFEYSDHFSPYPTDRSLSRPSVTALRLLRWQTNRKKCELVRQEKEKWNRNESTKSK